MQPYHLRRLFGPLLALAIGVTAVSWIFKGRLSGPTAIDPALLVEPTQITVSKPEFSFEYKGKECRVRPVADYELWGLVVSHNNIRSVADIYHDSTSVDTKDLCIIWGANLGSADYQQVKYKSGPWTCYFSYPGEVDFDHRAIGNNHLITDDPEIRNQIAGVRVGDQVHLKGLLVDYQMNDWQDFWRRTSTRRDDTDCEVVYVQELDVLRKGTPGWYLAYRLGWAAIFLLPIGYLVLMWVEAGRADSSTLGRL